MAQQDFHLGSQVYSTDGTEIGNLVHVLAEADGYAVKAIVVKEARHFTGHWLVPEVRVMLDEFIVPREAVRSVDHDRVELSLNDSQVRRLPAYLSVRERGESIGDEVEDYAAVFGSSPELPRWLEEVANKPADELEIDGGENVMLGHTGKKLGQVKDVLVESDHVVGIVMQPEGFFKEDVVVPRRFLERSDDAALFVKLKEVDVNKLPLFRPQ